VSDDEHVKATFADGPLAGLERLVPCRGRVIVSGEYADARGPVFHVYSWRSLDPPVLEFQQTRDTP